jgi:hypothetical protein
LVDVDVNEDGEIMGISPEDFTEVIRAIVDAARDSCSEKNVEPQGAMGMMMIAAITIMLGYTKLSREEVFALADGALAMAKDAFSGDDQRGEKGQLQ